jgi:hypothetical protein
MMSLGDIVFLIVAAGIWLLLVGVILPKFGVKT